MKKSQLIINKLQEILKDTEGTANEQIKTGEVPEKNINSYKYGYLKSSVQGVIERYGDAE